VLILISDGFEELETITWLTALRQAGLCVKTVGLTRGLVSGAYGIWLKPDLTFADLDHFLDTTSIRLVILPNGGQSLAGLEADPRVHKLLRQVVEQRGQIVTDPEGLPILRAAAVWGSESGEADDNPEASVLLRDQEKSPEVFALHLIRRLR
jgi:putative intracellular protease/amidase